MHVKLIKVSILDGSWSSAATKVSEALVNSLVNEAALATRNC